MGRLDIRVVEARNLPDTQLVGIPDPYVIVRLENQVHKSSVCENSVNPKWEEVFKFNVSDQNSAQLHFELWNKNLVSDEFLGVYKLSVAGLIKGEETDQWCLLQQCKSNAELRIRLLAQDFGLDKPEKAPPAIIQQPPVQAIIPQQPHGYPPQQYAAAQPFYAAAQPQGYLPQQGGYPTQQGYPPQKVGYPPQQQGGYPPQQPQYAGYPPQQGGYYPPQPQPGYYPPPQQYLPPQQPAYQPQQQYAAGYPPQF